MYYGAPPEVSANPSWNSAYMLLYESEDLQSHTKSFDDSLEHSEEVV